MAVLSLLVATTCLQSATPAPAAWRDPSPHRVLAISADQGVRLRVLDWLAKR